MRRRTFLALGVAGAAAFAAAGWWRALRAPASIARVLDDDATTIVSAIVRAMLDGALPTGPARAAAIADTVGNVDKAIGGLPPTARAELSQLFTLLAMAPARRAFAGVASPWADASDDEVAAFLDRWRDSGWALKRTAYDALHQLVTAAWYGDRRAWAAIGYPGPPRIGASDVR